MYLEESGLELLKICHLPKGKLQQKVACPHVILTCPNHFVITIFEIFYLPADKLGIFSLALDKWCFEPSECTWVGILITSVIS